MPRLTVIISGGFSSSYRQLLPEFERSTGISVTTLSGASQGKGPETIAAQLERGAAVDVAILSREGLSDLMAAGRIVAGSDVDLATAAIGVAVRAGARRPDVGTVEGFKQALLGAKLVAVPASTSGIFLMDVVFPKLGIADKLTTRVMPRGTQTAALVASGEADIAVLPTSELLHAPGLDYAGVIPDEFQLIQMFCAAIVAGSKELEGSKRLISFLASGKAGAVIRSNGMQPARAMKATATPLLEQVKIQAKILVPLVKALQAEMGEEKANALVRKALGGMFRRYGEAWWRTRSGGSLEAKVSSAFEMFAAGDALDYKVLKATPDSVELDVTGCRYAEFYKQIGAPELGFLLTCSGDADFFHPESFGARLTVTQTIM